VKKTRFSEEQMVTIRADRREAPPAARAGKWPAEKDGGRSRSRDRRAEGDHAKKMVGARVRRQQVAYAQGRGLSGRRACALLSVARSTLGYVSRLIARDAPVLPAVRTLVGQYPRYGYRRFGSFSSARATSSASIACIASGARKGCRCPRNARAVAWQPVGRGRCYIPVPGRSAANRTAGSATSTCIRSAST
jgi:hypothetical protein